MTCKITISEVPLEQVQDFLSALSLKKELKLNLTTKEGDRAFIVEGSEGVYGFCVVRPIANATFPWRGRAAEIKRLYVFEPHRRRKIGSRMMREIYKTMNCPIKATVLPSTQGFYEKLGFKKVFQRGQYPVLATDVPAELCIQ